MVIRQATPYAYSGTCTYAMHAHEAKLKKTKLQRSLERTHRFKQ